jgi:hypothetical protein
MTVTRLKLCFSRVFVKYIRQGSARQCTYWMLLYNRKTQEPVLFVLADEEILS